MPRTPESRRQQTARAREALSRRFDSSEAKSAHYRSLGLKSAAGRVVLSGEEAEALRFAISTLARIGERLGVTDV